MVCFNDYDDGVDYFKRVAWLVLKDNPASEYGTWKEVLIGEYAEVVVEAFGENPQSVFDELRDWWDTMDYEDPDTGICKTYCEWANYFVNDESVEIYDLLVSAYGELEKELKRVPDEKPVEDDCRLMKLEIEHLRELIVEKERLIRLYEKMMER